MSSKEEPFCLYHSDANLSVYLQEPAGEADVLRGSKKYKVVMCAPTETIKEVQNAAQNTAPSTSFAFRPQTSERMHKKAQKTGQARQLQLMRLSGQIDELAMRLFMSLSKTVPCKWFFEERGIKDPLAKPTAIVVLDELVIDPPYRPEDIRAVPGTADATVQWIGRMIEREREKLVNI